MAETRAIIVLRLSVPLDAEPPSRGPLDEAEAALKAERLAAGSNRGARAEAIEKFATVHDRFYARRSGLGSRAEKRAKEIAKELGEHGDVLSAEVEVVEAP